jgi:hypothetical protein
LTRVADKYRIRGKQENNFRKEKKMACLYKNGRELLRVSKVVEKYDEILQENLIVTYTRVLMENHYVLGKFKVYSKENKRANSYPWKRKGKLKKGKDPVDFQNWYESKGWKKELRKF